VADPTVAPEWRVIQSFPQYEVSDDGRVRRRTASRTRPKSCPAGSELPQSMVGRLRKRKSGKVYENLYLAVVLNNPETGVKRPFPVHRLVCEAFHGPEPTAGSHAAHNDGNRFRNVKDNVRWATPRENSHDRYLHGTDAVGSKNGFAKLTEAIVIAILRRIASGAWSATIAREFAVSESTIDALKRGKSWRHVPRPTPWQPRVRLAR
jgi:hypothetical protein